MPGKTMLGAAQMAWLKERLLASTAHFKLIVSTVPLDHGTTGNDCWGGFRREREGILRFIIDRRIAGVAFLSADQHWLSVKHYPSGVREYQVGPLTMDLRAVPSVPSYVVKQVSTWSFGRVRYAPRAGDSAPRLSFAALDHRADVLFEEEMLAGAVDGRS